MDSSSEGSINVNISISSEGSNNSNERTSNLIIPSEEVKSNDSCLEEPNLPIQNEEKPKFVFDQFQEYLDKEYEDITLSKDNCFNLDNYFNETPMLDSKLYNDKFFDSEEDESSYLRYGNYFNFGNLSSFNYFKNDDSSIFSEETKNKFIFSSYSPSMPENY